MIQSLSLFGIALHRVTEKLGRFFRLQLDLDRNRLALTPADQISAFFQYDLQCRLAVFDGDNFSTNAKFLGLIEYQLCKFRCRVTHRGISAQLNKARIAKSIPTAIILIRIAPM